MVRLPLHRKRCPKPEWTTLPGLDLPLIGREDAWQALTTAYRRYQGEGVIFISGEAGVGKSRLMQEFATDQTGLVLTGNSHAMGQALPYQPLVQALRLALPLPDRWNHISFVWLAEVSRLLPELRVHFPDLPQPVEIAPQQAQARLFEALTQVFSSLAADAPLLLCLDDVHWADEATLGWLQYTTKQLTSCGVCIVAAYRTHEAERLAEWQRALSRAGQVATIRLTRLTDMAVADLLHQAGVARTTAAALAGRIHAATGGNAFFVLETIRELLEMGKISDDSANLPLTQTVRDAVLRRVGRLTPLAQQVLAVAAVLSPHLRVKTLVETSGRTELETVDSLEELLARQLLRADGVNFRFQHDLAREAIYQDISPWRRRLLHRRAGESLEQLYQSNLAPFYPTLAHHWSRVIEDDTTDSGLASKTIGYLQKAGEQAIRSYAGHEAEVFLKNALTLLTILPDTSENKRQELKLQIALGHTLRATKAINAPEVKQAFSRALDLAQEVGEISQHLAVLRGLHAYYGNRGEYKRGLELAKEFLNLVNQVQPDPPHVVMAHRMMGMSLFFLGRFTPARRHFEQGLALYDPQYNALLSTLYGQNDPAVGTLTHLSLTLWCLGYPDQALRRSQEALNLARELGQPLMLAEAQYFAAFLHSLRREAGAALTQAQAAVNLATEQSFQHALHWGTFMRGWALAGQGQTASGFAEMEQGAAAYRTIGAEVGRAFMLIGLAERCQETGDIEAGLTALDEALAIADESGEGIRTADLYRLKGELLIQAERNKIKAELSDVSAEAYFLQAIELARRQQAKSWELRTTMSLSRLWQQQGKRAEAYQNDV